MTDFTVFKVLDQKRGYRDKQKFKPSMVHPDLDRFSEMDIRQSVSLKFGFNGQALVFKGLRFQRASVNWFFKGLD